MSGPSSCVLCICLVLPGVIHAGEVESAPPDPEEDGSGALIIELDDSTEPVADAEEMEYRNNTNGQIEFIIGGSSKEGIATRRNLPVID